MRFWLARCPSYRGYSGLGLMVRSWCAKVCRRAWIQAIRSWSQHLSRRHQWTLTFHGRKKCCRTVRLKGSCWCCPNRVSGRDFDTAWPCYSEWHDEGWWNSPFLRISRSTMSSLNIFLSFISLDSDDAHVWIWPCWSHTTSHSQQWTWTQYWMAGFCRKIVCQYSR